jgi:hypothetical protein
LRPLLCFQNKDFFSALKHNSSNKNRKPRNILRLYFKINKLNKKKLNEKTFFIQLGNGFRHMMLNLSAFGNPIDPSSTMDCGCKNQKQLADVINAAKQRRYLC